MVPIKGDDTISAGPLFKPRTKAWREMLKPCDGWKNCKQRNKTQ